MNELVTMQKNQGTTTSLLVAEKYGKRHDNVVRDIRKLMSMLPENRLLNFEERNYIDDRGKTYPYFVMTRDGFMLAVMRFTGEKALKTQWDFIDAFNRMEQILLNQQNLSWQQARLDGKNACRDLTDVIGAFVEYAAGQGSPNARMYYTVISKLTNQALGLINSASKKPFRDVLDGIHLSFLSSAEYVARQALLDGMTDKLHYKDIYKLARERIISFAAALPRQRIAA